MKGILKPLLLAALCSPVLLSCNNFFHDLVPPDGDRILSFSIPGQIASSIGEDTVTLTVPPRSERRCVPSISVSEGATVLPVTMDYILGAFPGEQFFGALDLYTGGNLTEQVIEMIKRNRAFIRPVLDKPVDFTLPVDFLVISGQGNVRQYRAAVDVDTGEGLFTSFSFEKFDNPYLVRRAEGTINNSGKTVEARASYPVENIADYKLIPAFTTNGARVFADGQEVISGSTELVFSKPPASSDLLNPLWGTQSKTLVLKREGYADVSYTVTVHFAEDPDTNRAITDFRFEKQRNPLIAGTFQAEINNSGDTGTITVTVQYTGSRPAELVPSFISPGTVRVGGTVQTSGYQGHDFGEALFYEVTSRTGGYKRTYRVTVVLVSASDPLPVISSFGFTKDKNPALAGNSAARIDHEARRIVIEAAVSGSPPALLYPEFAATGTVTCYGAVQTSGADGHDFSRPLEYTVTNPGNPTLKRTYRVETTFVSSPSAEAELKSFWFYRADNPGLLRDTEALVNQGAGTVGVTLLFDSPGAASPRTLVPRWTAAGQIESEGAVLTSGIHRRAYTGPVVYRAVSSNGLLRKDYTVSVKVVNSRIYVKQNAAGRGTGWNWDDAYRNLPAACADAALFPEDVAKEVWIARGTYTPSDNWNTTEYLGFQSNTSFTGGFAGTEGSKAARSGINGNRPFITGDLGGGRRSDRIFYCTTNAPGTIVLEDLRFAGAGNGAVNYVYGAGIFANAINCSMVLTNLSLDDIRSGYAGIYIRGGAVILDRLTFNDCRAAYAYGGASISGSTITVTNSSFTNCQAGSYGGAYIVGSNGVTVSDCSFTNCRADNEVGGVSITTYNNSDVTVKNSSFTDCFAGNDNDIGHISSSGTVSGCTFRHTTAHPYPPADTEKLKVRYQYNTGEPSLNLKVLLQVNGVTVENCSFDNLRSNLNSAAGINYTAILHPFTRDDLTVRNCIFNLTQYKVLALHINNPSTILDGVTVNDSGSGNMIWAYTTTDVPSITVRYRSNCSINGQSGAAFGNYIRCEHGAAKTMY